MWSNMDSSETLYTVYWIKTIVSYKRPQIEKTPIQTKNYNICFINDKTVN